MVGNYTTDVVFEAYNIKSPLRLVADASSADDGNSRRRGTLWWGI